MSTFLIDGLWPNWKIKRFIGEGTYGKVYEIHRTDTDDAYASALKVIHIAQQTSSYDLFGSTSKSTSSSYSRSIISHMMSEYHIMAKLKGNTNIVCYEDHNQVEHPDGSWTLLIRMELLEPVSRYFAHKGVSRYDLIRMGVDICRALEACAYFKIVHRDIKLGNIFVSEIGNFKLGDFGVAKTLKGTQGFGEKPGTYAYMSPEVYAGKAADSTADLYSLGLVMYQLMNGNRLPFVGDLVSYQSELTAVERRMSGERLPVPSDEHGELADIVLKACAYSPKDRYQHPKEMRMALEALLDQEDIVVFQKPAEEFMVNFSRITGERISSRVYTAGEALQIPKLSDVPPAADGRRVRFVGWYPQPQLEVTQNADYSADYETAEHQVRFLDETGAAISSRYYFSDEPLQIPPIPEDYGWEHGKQFAGWSPEPSDPVTSDQDYQLLLQDRDVGVTPQGDPKGSKKGSPKKRRVLLFGGAGIAALFVLLLIMFLPKQEASAPVAVPDPTPTPKPVHTAALAVPPSAETSEPPAETIAPAAEFEDLPVWSEWTENLSPDLGTEKYIVQTRQQYARVPLHERYSTMPNGAHSYSTRWSSDYGAWSDWQSAYVEGSNTRQVETKTLYEYAVEVKTETADLYHMYTTTSLSTVYRTYTGRISEQATQTQSKTDTSYVQKTETPSLSKTITQYRYRDKAKIIVYYLDQEIGEYTDEPIPNGAGYVVLTRTLYRALPKVTDPMDGAGMQNFPVTYQDYSGFFADISEEDWYSPEKIDAIPAAIAVGAMSVNEQREFRPKGQMTIAEVLKCAVVLRHRYQGKTSVLTSTESNWYQPYVDYAISREIIGANEFSDYMAIATRQDAASVLSRALPEKELPAIQTVEEITDMAPTVYGYDEILRLICAGVVSWPESSGEFRPKAPVSRAEAASMIYRLISPDVRIASP